MEPVTGLASALCTIPWFAWIAIVAIICGSGTSLLAMHHKHRERMEMIRQGMNPDGGKTPGREV
jgi:hypothetical protein